jgi:hypothetical protein
MDLRSELQSIYAQHERLTPALVVEMATPAEHPLHHRFEWDDSVAGVEYRKVQAAELIRSVRIVYAQNDRGESRDVRAFMAPQAPDKPNEYIPTREALADEFTRQLVLRQFQRALAGLRRQYGHLQEYDAMLRTEAGERVAS